MEYDERRKFSRIPKKDLPDFFKKLIIETDSVKNVAAEALDATVEGIAIRISSHVTDIKVEDRVTLHSLNHNFQFTGTVVNMATIDKEYKRLGIKFC